MAGIAKQFGFRDSDIKEMPKYEEKELPHEGADTQEKELPNKDANKLKEDL
jgi:hypothetical protein